MNDPSCRRPGRSRPGGHSGLHPSRWLRWRAGPNVGADRGDVPGWVLVTLMTAGLVLAIWSVAGPRLEEVFNNSIDRVIGGP